MSKADIVNLEKWQNLCLANLDRAQPVGQELTLVLGAQRQAQRKIFAKPAHGQHVQFMAKPRIARHAAPHYPECTRHQMQRRAYRLLKIVPVRNLMPKLGQRAKGMDQF